ncbi:hypothetical protein [Streptomyces fuscigenes]|uniref:hypothetical protein n=1 Tax=Streptomyces fuscigenes TaxID=1528880 RepID=UPI001F3E50BA|nr:hypothetical protein [Streptomyces fuscigenes]MCF3960315.1 hypothetical protein [Streptomyces fuscigenes]
MSLTRPELLDHLGQWVTVTNPNPSLTASWYGRLVALSDDPTVIIQAPGGGQGVFPQGFAITPADPPPPGSISPRRQAAYDTAHELIRQLGPDLPPDTVHRNADIWRAVTAALDAAGVSSAANPDAPPGATVTLSTHPGDSTRDTVRTPGDTPPRRVPGTGGDLETPLLTDGTAHDLTSNVPTRPQPGDTGDTTGDTPGDERPDGVRFAYRASVRRDQVHAALTEAFELLDHELHGGAPDA